jgi:hypothetical protein
MVEPLNIKAKKTALRGSRNRYRIQKLSYQMPTKDNWGRLKILFGSLQEKTFWPFGYGRCRLFFKFNENDIELLDLVDTRMINLKIYPNNVLPTYNEDQ